MRVHLINPSDVSFGLGVIAPRWLYVLATATPAIHGDPILVDETLQQVDPDTIQKGDIVGIGIHTANALRGYEVGRIAREKGASVVFGGIHCTLYPDEAFDLGAAHAVVQGDGDTIWSQVLADWAADDLQRVYDAGQIPAEEFLPGRWDLLPTDKYMWASVQTVRGCPKHCSFCSVWRTDGRRPRQRDPQSIVQEVVTLRRLGFRFIALADDNFYPVSLAELETAKQRTPQRVPAMEAIREERFALMEALSKLPKEMIFFTQITMEAAEDTEFLEAMRKARIRGALVGIESVTEEGLKSVKKEFNLLGVELENQLKKFREHGIFVLGSFIFGLPTDTDETFAATAELAERADLAFAQFVNLTPFPGTIDFLNWEKEGESSAIEVNGTPLSRYWLIPGHLRPKLYIEHPSMPSEEIRQRTQGVWDRYYSLRSIWGRSSLTPNLKARLAFVMISKLYRQMYANTGIATDSARQNRATAWAGLIMKFCRKLFLAPPVPELEVPE